ncbi:hypothetical protein NECAME_06569 [Necator americanus]|uniref:Uncharacterized protein n=1 Tax=Necator americanus TaxID=51031 RepID=W2TTI8_NECAM|nr:hypothetical protein NECAME_06569 [Necator americanus]ETN85103.1 hypothetical protein NECAME_06569 [Necator americanus]
MRGRNLWGDGGKNWSRFVYLVAALNEVQNVVGDSEKLGIEHTAGKRTPRHGNNYEEKNFE